MARRVFGVPTAKDDDVRCLGSSNLTCLGSSQSKSVPSDIWDREEEDELLEVLEVLEVVVEVGKVCSWLPFKFLPSK